MKNINIHPTALIGEALRPLQGMVLSHENPKDIEVKYGEELYVGPYSIIGQGVILGNKVIIDSFSNIERGVIIGENTIIVHRATIGGYSRIGKDCVIGGLVGEGTIIGNGCRIFGTVVHKQDDPSQSWDHRAEPEPSVIIRDNSFVGFEAFVAGDIEIGPQSYICAEAVITKSVPPGYIAFGRNEMIHHSEWKGALGQSPVFKGV
jgi:UDP-3-O-[3-hydroxymyristoyl] glucosamine N-acyltransferase